MRIGAIIFSRMSSGRLPGKAMMDISGKSLLLRVIERTKCLKKVDHICVATSDRKDDDVIEELSRANNIDVFRGNLEDVSSRAYNASLKYKYDSFLRVCADRPFLDSNLYDSLIKTHLSQKNDLTTNIFPRVVPPGLTGEVIKIKALKLFLDNSSDVKDREHLTRYFYHNSSKFKIQNIDELKDLDLNHLRLVVDDEVDLLRAKWIASTLKEKKCQFQTSRIISLAKIWEQKNYLIKKNK
jgi:spore coat polysaccharide biosynthesis protein SpsF